MNWQCDLCGTCCKLHWRIELWENDIQILENLGYPRKTFVKKKGKRFLMKRKLWGNGCVFLKSEGGCIIQEKHGYEFKPHVCRAFPHSGKSNQMVCGIFSEDGGIDGGIRDYEFRINGKSIPSKTILLAINKLEAGDYVGMWDWLLRKMGERKSVNEPDISQFVKEYNGTKPTGRFLKLIIAEKSGGLLLGTPKVFLRMPVIVRSAVGKFRFDWDTDGIGMDKKTMSSFLDILKSGNGIVYKPSFPDHLLFNLYFLESFSKSIAKEEGKTKVSLSHLMSAYARLNGLLRFPE